MNKIKVIIADDERPAREFLKSMLREFSNVDLAGEAGNGADAVDLIRTVKPDLAILDLKMPEMSGIDVVRLLRRSQMPLVVFVTAHDEYAVQAFELNAVDYLLKPVDRTRLAETMERAADRIEREDWRTVESARMKLVAESYGHAESSQPIERIPVRQRDEIILIPTKEIASIVADGELLIITTESNAKYVISYRLKDLETRLDPRSFVRLSRGAVVNLTLIDRISPVPGGTYIVSLTNGQEISSSRLQSRLLRSRLLKI